MPCMCGDTACWSCGPAQGSPSCEYSKRACGDPSCHCADPAAGFTSLEEQRREDELEATAYAAELEADAALAHEYRDVIHSDPRRG